MSSPSGQPVDEQENIEEGSNHTGIASGSSAPSSASGSPYCIFKIPEYLTHNRHNLYGYQPSIVSIGPYHHGKQHLKWIQGEKEKFQKLFISRGRSGMNQKKLCAAVADEEIEIRTSFFDIPAGVDVETNLINMMVLDGCFLLTLFLVIEEKETPEESPIFSMPWALSSIRRDLLLLQNQIPMIVLKTLLDTADFPKKYDLNKIALGFFKDSFKNRKTPRTEENLGQRETFKAKHLLDLIHHTFIPIPPKPESKEGSSTNKTAPEAKDEIPDTSIAKPPQSSNAPESQSEQVSSKNETTSEAKDETRDTSNPIPPQSNIAPESKSAEVLSPVPKFLKLKLSAKELSKTGVKIELKKNTDTFLNISFQNGVIQIPEIILDDFLSVVLLNCIAFEQFYPSRSTHVTSYAMFMGCLISNERDTAYLVEKGIIQNYLGTEDEVSLFFKRILNDYVFDIEKSYLADVIKDVDEYSSNDCNVLCANCKQIYMGSPWIFLSTLAAVALLLLTTAQVVLAAIAL